MKEAFSKPIILLCWQRLRIPLEMGQWPLNLDAQDTLSSAFHFC